MDFRVLKFGGSSVADATAMSRVLDIVGGEMNLQAEDGFIDKCLNDVQ